MPRAIGLGTIPGTSAHNAGPAVSAHWILVVRDPAARLRCYGKRAIRSFHCDLRWHWKYSLHSLRRTLDRRAKSAFFRGQSRGSELLGHRVSGSSSHYVRVNSPQKPPTAPTTISRWPWGLRSLLHPFFWGGPPGGDKRRKKACISLTHAQCNMVHCRLNHEGYSASMLTSC